MINIPVIVIILIKYLSFGGDEMEYQEIDYNSFLEHIKEENSSFLCGNGFSINFDSYYSLNALTKRLWNTHCHVENYRNYDVVSNPTHKYVFEENFKLVRKALKAIKSEKNFSAMFSCAVDFANSLITNQQALDWLDENNYKSSLVFGLNRIDLVSFISEQAKQNGDMFVNYEYWSVLIYYILALQEAPTSVYLLDKSNIFIKAVLIGSTNIFYDNSYQNILMNVACNGMYTYLRFLFTSNILLDGKSYNVTKLKKWNVYDIQTIKKFLLNFNYLITTNYDQLLERITERKVSHLHGSYSRDKKRVMSESLGMLYDGIRYDLTSAVIGDYFLAKTFLSVVTKLSAKNSQNTPTETYSQILDRIIRDDKSNLIVIFGLNIDNDYHLLRDIQIYLGEKSIVNPQIIYCYYSEYDRDSFKSAYEKCLTYSAELTKSIQENVVVSVISSKKISENIFIQENDKQLLESEK